MEQYFAKEDSTVPEGLDETVKENKGEERKSIFKNELSITKLLKVKMFLFIDNSALNFSCSKSLKLSIQHIRY